MKRSFVLGLLLGFGLLGGSALAQPAARGATEIVRPVIYVTSREKSDIQHKLDAQAGHPVALPTIAEPAGDSGHGGSAPAPNRRKRCYVLDKDGWFLATGGHSEFGGIACH